MNDGMRPWLPPRSWPGWLPAWVLLAVVYFAAARLGLALTFVNASASPVWPPTGVAIAALLLLGRRAWPGVLAGAYVANALTTGWGWPSLVIAGGNTLEAVAGSWLVGRFAGGVDLLATPKGVVRFGLLAGLLAPLVSASIGVATLVASGNAPASAAPSIWSTWWLGDATGAILLAPAIVAWARPGAGAQRLPETLLALALLGALASLVFSPLLEQASPLLLAAPLPALAWLAMRLGRRATATGTLLLAAIAVWGTLARHGPIIAVSPNAELLLLQAYLGVSGLAALAATARRPIPEAASAPEEAAWILRRSRAAGLAGAVLVTALGLMVLAGWASGIAALKGPVPGAASMKVNTALCFAALGIAMLATRDARPMRPWTWAVTVLPIVVAGLTLTEYLSGSDLGIDELLAKDDLSAVATSSPGRMSPFTAIGFLLLPTALLLRDRGDRWRAFADGLCLTAGAIGLLSLTSYIYGGVLFAGTTQVAAHTAAGLIAASGTVILLGPRNGLGAVLASPEVDGRLARTLPTGIILLPLLLGLVGSELQQEGRLTAEQGVVFSIFGSAMLLAVVAALTLAQARRILQERQKAQADLQRSEEQVRNLLEAAPDATIVVDGAGRIVRANAQAEGLFGYPRRELVGQSVDLLVPDAQRAGHPGQRAGYMRDPHLRPMGVGLRLSGRRKDGTLVPVEISLSPLRLADGMHVIAAVRDVTVQREAQDKLARTIASVSEAERVTGRGSWEWDTAKDKAVWSAGMYRLFGVDPATFVNSNENFLAMVHPDDRARMGQAIADALAKPGRFYQEYRLTRPDGQLLWLEGEGNVVPDPEGKASLVYGVVQDVTELRRLREQRKEGERALAESERRLRAIFDQSPVGLTLARPDGALILANQAAADLWRRTPDEMARNGFQPSSLFVDERDREALGEALRRDGRVTNREVRVRLADGAERTLNLGIALVRHDTEPAVLSAAIDITAQKEAELRFRLLFEANPVAVVISRADGSGFVDVNPAYSRLIGFSREELLSPDFDVTRISTSPERRAKLLASLRESGGADALEIDVRRKDGAIRTVVASVRSIDYNGQPSFLTALQDVTEQRATEAAARKAQERFASVFRSSPVAIALSKEDGRFVDVNDAFAALVGRPRNVLLDPKTRATEVWADPQERGRMLNAIRGRGLVRDLEVRIQRPDGEVRTALASIEFIDLGGDTTILSLLQDITDRLKAQQDREARISTEAELERLRRTDAFRTEFINSTAHELATPLTPLVLNVRTLAADKQLTEAQRHLVESLARNVTRLRHLVDDMVGAADLQARTLALDKRRLNLTRELKAAVAAHHPAAERAGIRLDEPEDSGVTVSADPARLQLVLGHLLGNAIKFTPPGGNVVVASRREDDVVRVVVADTGIGMTAKQMEGLWKPFAQAHDKSQRTDSGSGLGLYVTKGIVELHGGEVGCSSPGPGKGSKFWFTLPLATGHVDPLSKSRPGGERGDGPHRNLNPSVRDD